MAIGVLHISTAPCSLVSGQDSLMVRAFFPCNEVGDEGCDINHHSYTINYFCWVLAKALNQGNFSGSGRVVRCPSNRKDMQILVIVSVTIIYSFHGFILI